MPKSRPTSAHASWNPKKSSRPSLARQHLWQTSSGFSSPARGRWRTRITAGLGILGFVALMALLVYVSLWIQPAKGTALVLVGAGYEDNLAVPHNVYGTNGLEAVAELSVHHNVDKVRLQHLNKQLIDATKWDRNLRNIPEKNIVVFLSMQGAADAGGAYLVPQKAYLPLEPDSMKADLSRIRIADVLHRLEKLPSNRNIVLILDATGATNIPHAGTVYNSFVRALDKLNSRIEGMSNLIVLCASDADQKSWTSEELRRTIFSHYVVWGMQGAADKDEDNRVTALELHNYVAEQVERWVALNRGARQTPMLLPRGAEGEERARGIKLAVVREKFKPKFPEDLNTQPPAALNTAWQNCQRLAKIIPGPEVYTPGLWREYRETLLRYEQLVVAGETEISPTLLTRLNQLGGQINEQRRLKLNSMQNTLTMPAAAGYPLLEGGAAAQAVNQLLEAENGKQKQLWQKILKAHQSTFKDTGKELFRLKVIEKILQQNTGDAEQLDSALALINQVRDAAAQLPAEAHFLAMLGRDLPRVRVKTPSEDGVGPPKEATSLLLSPNYLQTAMVVRLLAEQSALGLLDRNGTLLSGQKTPYSEQVSPWINGIVTRGDEHRRRGQDLLFTTKPVTWKKAWQEHFLQAEILYKQAGDAAHAIRLACKTRDQVAEMLPFYAQWGIRHMMRFKSDKIRDKEELQSDLEKLAEETQQLSQLLEMTPTPRKIALQVETIEKQTGKATKYLKAVESAFRQARTTIPEEDSIAVRNQIDDLLVVPFAESQARLSLLKRRNQIGQRLLRKTEMPTSKHKTPTAVATLQQAREAGKRRGRLALALMGKDWFNNSGGAVKEDFKQVQYRLDNIDVREDWWKWFQAIGREIGVRVSQMTAKTALLLNVNRKAPPADLKRALQQADRLLRLIDGTGNSFLSKVPPLRLRHLQVEQLLYRQTTRTYMDHWAAEDANATEPYFRRLGRIYLNDLGELKTPPQPQEKTLRADLTRSDKLMLSLASAPGIASDQKTKLPGDYVLHLTTEREVPLAFRLQPAPGAAPLSGYPVLWITTGKDLKPLRKEELDRRAVLMSGNEKTLFHATLTSPLLSDDSEPPAVPTIAESTIVANGYFRGHTAALTTPVQIHRLPQMVRVQHPLPMMAGIAVRAAKNVHGQFGTSTGNVVIILDASGSMGPPKGQEIGPNTKYAEAVAALQRVLSTIPKGTTVSVWVFGQAMGERKTVKDAERTVKPVTPPLQWDPNNSAQLEGLMAKLKAPAIEPWNESPLMRAMLRAAREDLSDVYGFKTLIVITDSMDNRIQNDREYNPEKKDVATLLRENFGDIEVNIIGFKFAGQEQAAARQQFAEIENLPNPGKFYTVEESGQLVLTLKKVFPPKMQYAVGRIDGKTLPGPSGVSRDVSRKQSNDQWLPGGLPPGNYRVRVNTGNNVAANFSLSQADLLLLELGYQKKIGEASRLGFKRILYSQSDYPWKPKAFEKSQGNWVLALLQNQLKPGSAAQMLLTLERKDDALAPLLRQIQPGTVWGEVSTNDGDRGHFSQRWYFQPGYPAAAYSVDIPRWPTRRLPSGGVSKTGAAAKPEVRVWWTPGTEKLRGTVLEQGHQFAIPAELQNRRVQMDDQEVIIDSVRVEKHFVEVEPPRRDIPAQHKKWPCLVVRITYPKDQPVWARLHGIKLRGAEHRYFSRAEKYTGIFWPVTKEQAEQVVRGIEIISVARFKKNAERRNYFIAMKDLSPPNPGDNRPLPPVNLTQLPLRDLNPQNSRPQQMETNAPSTPPIPAPPPVTPATQPMAPIPRAGYLPASR